MAQGPLALLALVAVLLLCLGLHRASLTAREAERPVAREPSAEGGSAREGDPPAEDGLPVAGDPSEDGAGAGDGALPTDELAPDDIGGGSDATSTLTRVLGNGSWTSVSREAGGLEQVATRLLGSYRDAGDCALAHAGYLDLVGSVWACVVAGDGWSEVCVVQALGADASEVRVLRIEADEIADALGGQGGS